MSDPLIGYTYKNKAGNKVAVLGWEGDRNSSHLKQYNCYCDSCSQDKELFPSPRFLATKRQILEGILGCGCNKSYSYTFKQRILLLRRMFEDSEINFLGLDKDTYTFFYNFNGSSETLSCSYKHAITKGTKLPKPRPRNMWTFKPQDQYLEYLKLWDSDKYAIRKVADRTDAEGNWEITCRDCLTDRVGLAGGTVKFYTRTYQLKRGITPCRCGNHKYSYKDKVILCNLRCKEEGTGFHKLENGYVYWWCKNNHYTRTPYYQFAVLNRGCNNCHSGVDHSKPSHVYLCKWVFPEREVYKFGITTDSSVKRFISQKHYNYKAQYQVIGKVKVSSGYLGLHFEKLFKSCVAVSKDWHPVSKVDFPDGYTEAFTTSEPLTNEMLDFIFKKILYSARETFKEALESK